MRPAVWCHMTADTKAELHAFAQSIGCSRSWFQDPVEQGKCERGCAMAGHWHYDVTKGMRAKAVKAGAVEIGHGLSEFEMIWHYAGREGIKLTDQELGIVKVAQRFCPCGFGSNGFTKEKRSGMMVHSKCMLPTEQYYLAYRSAQPPGKPIKYAKGIKPA